MNKFTKPVMKMNLHLFDGGADGASSATSTTGTSDNSTGNTQPEQGEVNNANSIKQVANASHQDGAVTSDDDLGRTQFENYIRGEGKQYYTEATQKMVNARFKETKQLEKNAQAIQPSINALASLYGVDPTDFNALNEAILNDNKLYEARAKENGVTVEVQKKFDTIERRNQELEQSEQQRQQEQRRQEILDNWRNESEELKKDYPDFDLDTALDTSKDFFDLVVRGIPIRNAYQAVFSEQFAKNVEKKITDNIRARGVRPSENGASSNATATQRFDVGKLTPAQRREYANRASRGEVITFT